MRASRTTPLPNNLFPMLSVLVGMIGALIVLLLAVTKLAQTSRDRDALAKLAQAQNSEKENSARKLPNRIQPRLPPKLPPAELPLQSKMELPSLPDIVDRRSQLEARLSQLQAEIENAKKVGTQVQESQGRVKQSTLDLGKLQKQLDDVTAEKAQTQQRLAILAAERDSLDRQLRRRRLAAQVVENRFAIVPYVGPQGTKRKPIYLECRADAIVLQPENVSISAEQLRDSGSATALAAVVGAVAEQIRSELPGESPYPLLLVRPDGISAFYVARQAILGRKLDCGFELIDDNARLAFPKPDPKVAAVAANVMAAMLEGTFATAAEGTRSGGTRGGNEFGPGIGRGSGSSPGSGLTSGTGLGSGSGLGVGKNRLGNEGGSFVGARLGGTGFSDVSGRIEKSGADKFVGFGVSRASGRGTASTGAPNEAAMSNTAEPSQTTSQPNRFVSIGANRGMGGGLKNDSSNELSSSTPQDANRSPIRASADSRSTVSKPASSKLTAGTEPATAISGYSTVRKRKPDGESLVSTEPSLVSDERPTDAERVPQKSPTVTFDQLLAASERGDFEGTPGQRPTPPPPDEIGIGFDRRPLRKEITVVCRGDGLIVYPEGRVLAIAPTTSIAEIRIQLADIVREQRLGWGTSGRLFRWDPVFVIAVAPDGVENFYRLQLGWRNPPAKIERSVVVAGPMDGFPGWR